MYRCVWPEIATNNIAMPEVGQRQVRPIHGGSVPLRKGQVVWITAIVFKSFRSDEFQTCHLELLRLALLRKTDRRRAAAIPVPEMLHSARMAAILKLQRGAAGSGKRQVMGCTGCAPYRVKLCLFHPPPESHGLSVIIYLAGNETTVRA